MEPASSGWIVPVVRKALSWLVVVLWLLLGVAAVALLESQRVFSIYSRPEWSHVAGFSLLGLVALLASVIAIEDRRPAGLLFLISAPIVAGCIAWWQRISPVVMGVSVARIIAVCAATSLLFLVPGVFWLVTARADWPPLALNWKRRTRIGVRALLSSVLLISCVALGLFVTLNMPNPEWDCQKHTPPVFAPRFPDHAVFTAKVTFVGNTNGPLPDFSYWAVARVQHRFWGLSRWVPRFILLREIFRRGETREYFVDGRRSTALLAHFLPVIAPYRCSHTQPLERAAADLRALQEGPPKSGVRIIGSVYTSMYLTSVPARGIEILITGPAGTVTATTDQEGVYDFGPLPPGHYSVQVAAAEPRLYMSRAEGDPRSGQVWGATLLAPPSGHSTH